MIVSHKYRCIFLRTEKTGGTSITQALQSMLGDDDEQATLKRPAWAKYSPIHHGALKRHFPQWFGLHRHATAKQVRDVVGPRIFESYFKFAIERNPWDRQVSLYAHRQWKKGNETLNFDRDMRSPIYRNTEYVRLNNWSIYAIGRQIVVDRLLRYETLADDIERLLSDLGIESQIQIPRLRSYISDRPHYSTFYSDWTRELIGRWYTMEIKALGYRFESVGEAGADAASPAALNSVVNSKPNNTNTLQSGRAAN